LFNELLDRLASLAIEPMVVMIREANACSGGTATVVGGVVVGTVGVVDFGAKVP